MGTLEELLAQYADSEYYRFHMPGHKGNSRHRHYQMDITEIDGFDDLHHPEGILKKGMEEAARFYGSRKTYYLVNGSTCGILAAISAAVKAGGELLIARNSHKAAYNACDLRGLTISTICPKIVDKYQIQGEICVKSIKDRLEELPDVQAVFLTSPTYEGVVSDIKAIAKVVHAKGIPLIVDEAHGAHFGLHPDFPESALQLGADVVIQSLHKTMDALTQTALLHIGKDARVDDKAIERYLDIYQTTSPSYLLMASIQRCIEELQEHKAEMFADYVAELKDFYREMEGLKCLSVIPQNLNGKNGVFARDMGKLVIVTDGSITGRQLYDRLREDYRIQPEMAVRHYVICMTSYKDTREGFKRLGRALLQIDEELSRTGSGQIFRPEMPDVCDGDHISIARALAAHQKTVPLWQSVGEISGQYAYVYPPGVPMLIPGEVITEEIVAQILGCMDMGCEVKGCSDRQIQVCVASSTNLAH